MSSSTIFFNGLYPQPEPAFGVLGTWLHEQEHDLAELKAARKACTESTQCDTELIRSFADLVELVLSHYENYYHNKSEWLEQNILHMLTPSSFRSNLEEAFLWIGGWRPSTAFHLLYSTTGLQLEAGLSKLLSGLSTGDLGDLSPSQLITIDQLQRQTIKDERMLTEKLAAHQETIADSTMIQLSQCATELKEDPNPDRVRTELVKEGVKSTLDTKEEEFKEILRMADDLRLRALRNVASVLSPIQAIHFLIAAVELHLRVHEWGMNKDAGVDPQ